MCTLDDRRICRTTSKKSWIEEEGEQRVPRLMISGNDEPPNISRAQTTHLFDPIILPALCYASKTWTDIVATSKTLRIVHRILERCLLRTTGVVNIKPGFAIRPTATFS